MKKGVLFLLLAININVFAHSKIDSLVQIWKNSNFSIDIRFNAVKLLAWEGYLIKNPDSAIYFAELYYSLADSLGDKKQMATALYINAYANKYKSQNEVGLDKILKALKFYQEIKNQLGESNSYGFIGTIYFEQKNYEDALSYYNKALKIAKELDNLSAQATLNNNIGNVFKENEEYLDALNYYLKSIYLKKKLGDRKGLASTYTNIGNSYASFNSYEKAIKYHNKSFSIYREFNDEFGQASACVNMASTYRKKKDYQNAILSCEKAMVHAQEIKSVKIINAIYHELYQIYRSKEEFQLAIEMLEKHLELQEILSKTNAEEELQIMKLADEYDLKKQKDNLKHQQEIAEKQETINKEQTFSYTLIGLMAFIVISLLIIIERYAKTKKQKKIIEEKNNVLERLSLVVRETENVILILDHKGKIEWVNDSFIRLNKLNLDELIAERGNNILEISNFPNIGEVLENCKSSRLPFQYDSINYTKTGDKVWESSTITPVFNKDGTLTNYIIIDTDITKQKSAEELVSQKNKDITDSLNYAKRLQNAILPPVKSLKQHLPNSFVLYLPKGIVSGDFYWIEKINDVIYFAVADCTGHGVPGAMVSVICSNFLSKAFNEEQIYEPAAILNRVRELVINKFGNSAEELRDGMDISLCALNLENKELEWAGANNPLWIIRKASSSVEELLADKQPIGMFVTKKPFTNHKIELNTGDLIYLFSDGYADQFGEKTGKKYKSVALKRLLLKNKELGMEGQLQALNMEFEKWKGALEQIDDVCLMGVKI